MKRKVIIPLVVFLAILGIGAAIKYRPHTVPWEECSEVYRRYATTDGIRASYIKDYRVNDTITLNITLLEATDSAGWDLLQNDFSIKQPEDSTEIAALEKGGDIFGIIQNNTITSELEQSDIATSSYRDRYVTIFHTRNSCDKTTIRRAIFLHKIKQLNQQP